MTGFYSKQFFTFLVILLSFNYYIISSSAARHLSTQTSTEFIKKSCSSTSYPMLCFSTLSRHANLIQNSPKILAHTALNVTLFTAKSVSNMMITMSHRHGMKPREMGAMKDCVEELSASTDALRRSLDEFSRIGSADWRLTMSDIQTWVSAALTDDMTCTDGFEGKEMNGNVKDVVGGQILKVAHLTSNALALINRSHKNSRQFLLKRMT
ncbi:PMEI domain-containing protein [Cephalotus follicularis]|uniref:PMEI domain-containing protein n=1 Tax=Cephalotus follicularis TaxID=3775 RepID=A0A1Q3BA48_CEPFO|nr:PMEI domain-containing protein [Cephalotus follicularis]